MNRYVNIGVSCATAAGDRGRRCGALGTGTAADDSEACTAADDGETRSAADDSKTCREADNGKAGTAGAGDEVGRDHNQSRLRAHSAGRQGRRAGARRRHVSNTCNRNAGNSAGARTDAAIRALGRVPVGAARSSDAKLSPSCPPATSSRLRRCLRHHQAARARRSSRAVTTCGAVAQPRR